MVWGVGQVGGQRRQFLQDIIQRLKSSPRHQSSSPSWFGERQFEVIGTGRLPLQSHNIDTNSDGYDRLFVEDNFDSFYSNSDRRINNEEITYAENTYIPNKKYSYDSPALGQDREYYQVSQTSKYPPGSSDYKAPDSFHENFRRLRRKPDQDTYFQSPRKEWDRPISRNKRSPFKRIKIKVNNPFYFSNPSHPKRKEKESPRPRRHQEQHLNLDRFVSGPQGFWDDANFDTNFFDRGHFSPPEVNLGYSSQELDNYPHDDRLDTVPQYRPVPGIQDNRGHTNNQDRSHSVSYDKVNLGGSQFANVRNYLEREEKNDILGSGNFIIETGGTFYDGDELPYSYRNHHNYYDNNFNNFRDFADIKRERVAGRRYQY